MYNITTKVIFSLLSTVLLFTQAEPIDIEETVFEEDSIGTTDSNLTSAKRDLKVHRNFKDPDACEDACEDDCETACWEKCGQDEDCNDQCKDMCEEGCEGKCAGYATVYGPRRGAFLLSVPLNLLLLHSSGVSREEESFLRETGINMVYRMSDGSSETVDIQPSFRTYAFGIELTYFLSEKTGIGLAYQYSYTEETYGTTYQYFSEELLSFHSCALKLDTYIWHNRRVAISLTPHIGACLGTIHRLPVLYSQTREQNISQSQKDFYLNANKPVTALGVNAKFQVNLRFMINHLLAIFGGPVYTYNYVSLTNDNLTGYPKISVNHDFGIGINIGLLLNGLNLNLNQYKQPGS